jgi:general secretion pathway protein G
MIRRDNQARNRRSAFTLLEILVVVAIIAALAGVGGVFVMGQWESSRKQTAKIQIKQLDQAVDLYKLRHGDFPQSLDQLFSPVGGEAPMMTDGNARLDPWGTPYHYEPNDTKPRIWTDRPGQNGQPISNY